MWDIFSINLNSNIKQVPLCNLSSGTMTKDYLCNWCVWGTRLFIWEHSKISLHVIYSVSIVSTCILIGEALIMELAIQCCEGFTCLRDTLLVVVVLPTSTGTTTRFISDCTSYRALVGYNYITYTRRSSFTHCSLINYKQACIITRIRIEQLEFALSVGAKKGCL